MPNTLIASGLWPLPLARFQCLYRVRVWVVRGFGGARGESRRPASRRPAAGRRLYGSAIDYKRARAALLPCRRAHYDYDRTLHSEHEAE
jgi:hypothetical protein